MAVVNTSARAAAAAFLFGVALTASPAVAADDDSGTASTAAGSAGAAGSPAPARASRGSVSATRSGPPRPAATRETTANATATTPTTSPATTSPAITSPAITSPAMSSPATVSTEGMDGPAGLKVRAPRRGAPDSRAAADLDATPGPNARIRPERTSAIAGTVAAPPPTTVSAAAVAAPVSAPAPQMAIATAVPAAPSESAQAAAQPTAAQPTVSAAAEPARAQPAPVVRARMSASTGTAALTVADLFTGLLAPIQELFEGALLLVRRTFFNQAPMVSPVQLTGQGEGPITGTIGAVDPEGDPLTYSITTDPRYGTAVIDAAGTYTYTPGPGFSGTDSFIATATDSGAGINLFDLLRAPGTAGNVAVNQGAQAAVVQFQFIYGDGAQFWSPAARSNLEYAATTLATTLVVDSPVVLTYTVTGEFSPFSATLASAGSDLSGYQPGFLQTVAQNKILTGTDPNGSDPDGTISWNFGPGWAFGDTVPGNQYDFQSTAMHELLHTLGFLTYVDRAGLNTGRTWTDFDSNLVTSDGTAVIDGSYTWNSAYNANLTGGNGGLYFGGPNAVAAYGGFVPLYTPSPWEAGSSLSHLDDSTFVGANQQLMNARISAGPGIRIISPIEAAVLQDLGYTVFPGGTSALMFMGLFFVRRPRSGSRNRLTRSGLVDHGVDESHLVQNRHRQHERV